MRTNLLLLITALTFAVSLMITDAGAMQSKVFAAHENLLKFQGDVEVIGEITLKPGEEKDFETYSYKPVTIDFKTSVSEKISKKCKNDGVGIKKISSLKYYLKDPVAASMDVLPDNGVVKVSVKNFEKFPITVKVYKVTNKKT